MNTLRDTNEGRARPSVWPVYVAAVMLMTAGPSIVVHRVAHWLSVACWLLAFAVALGLVRLRPWAWWCAVIITAGWAASGASYVCSMILMLSETPDMRLPVVWVVFLTAWLLILALLIVPLATRRRLFFPPKPEAEE